MGLEELIDLAGPTTAAYIDQSAGLLLQQARKQRGMSVSALATVARVPRSTISRIEQHQMQPSLPLLQQLMVAMGLELRISVAEFDDHDLVLDRMETADPGRAARARQGVADSLDRYFERQASA